MSSAVGKYILYFACSRLLWHCLCSLLGSDVICCWETGPLLNLGRPEPSTCGLDHAHIRFLGKTDSPFLHLYMLQSSPAFCDQREVVLEHSLQFCFRKLL